MEFIKINLLPHREWRQVAQKQQFNRWLLWTLVAAVLSIVVVYVGLEQMINRQTQRNMWLKNEIQALDIRLQSIANIETEKSHFLERKKVIESLQNQRFDGAKILDTLNASVPDGVYLVSFTAQDEHRYQIVGKAMGESRIAELMRRLPQNGVFQTPELSAIKKTEQTQEFTLTVSTRLGANDE